MFSSAEHPRGIEILTPLHEVVLLALQWNHLSFNVKAQDGEAACCNSFILVNIATSFASLCSMAEGMVMIVQRSHQGPGNTKSMNAPTQLKVQKGRVLDYGATSVAIP